MGVLQHLCRNRNVDMFANGFLVLFPENTYSYEYVCQFLDQKFFSLGYWTEAGSQNLVKKIFSRKLLNYSSKCSP